MPQFSLERYLRSCGDDMVFYSSCSYLCPSYDKYCVFEGVSICKKTQISHSGNHDEAECTANSDSRYVSVYCAGNAELYFFFFSERDGRK